jgi:polysaccharide pyruvyl transferase WcaK-like protein
MARYLLKRASLVYSRDQAGIGYVNKLLNNRQNGKVKFAPDVAFILDARKPEHLDIEPATGLRARHSIVVGLNVSGLLFCGGYKSNSNMFGLKNDYCDVIYSIIEMLLKDERASILLIPHVFAPDYFKVESDPDACLKIYEQFKQIYPSKIFLVKGKYDQGEIKYVIGLCDVFVGSRMHSCIAAISQCVPAVGLAYSDKFEGVFETAQNEQYVLDMRNHRKDEILKVVLNAFEERKVIRNHLQRIIPGIQNKVMNLFEDIGVR